MTLATNSGMDPIDTQVELRAKHGQGKKWFGVDCLHGKCGDMEAEEVFEPTAVKEQIIKSSTEAASMILRIDDVIASSKSKMPSGPPGGGGMGGGGWAAWAAWAIWTKTLGRFTFSNSNSNY